MRERLELFHVIGQRLKGQALQRTDVGHEIAEKTR